MVCNRLQRHTQARYSGVLCTGAMLSLVRSVGVYTGSSPTLERIDGAMLVANWDGYSRLDFMQGGPAGAVIVRPDQYDATVELCQLLAGMGIIRTVWTTAHVDRAQAWLDRHS